MGNRVLWAMTKTYTAGRRETGTGIYTPGAMPINLKHCDVFESETLAVLYEEPGKWFQLFSLSFRLRNHYTVDPHISGPHISGCSDYPASVQPERVGGAWATSWARAV